jgi:hypothetical protein
MNTRPSLPYTTIDELRSRKVELVSRLNKGDDRIAAAKRNGADTTRLEDHWITLLHEYELVCRALSDAGIDQYPAAA